MPPHLVVLIESILCLFLVAEEAQNNSHQYYQDGNNPYNQINYLVFLISFAHLVAQIIFAEIGDAFVISITIVTKCFISLTYLILCALANRSHCFTATSRVVLILAILVRLTLIYTLSLLHAHIVVLIAASRHALVAKFAII